MRLIRLPTLIVALLMASTGLRCGKKPHPTKRSAPAQGVVGKVLTVRGQVSYSVGARKAKHPLKVGMELRAEWTVHTGPDGELTALLTNGHRWSLAPDLSKRVGQIRALTLAPVKESKLAQLSGAGARRGADRSAAAGLYQGRTAAKSAAPDRIRSDLDETEKLAARPAPRLGKKGYTHTTKPPRKAGGRLRRPRKQGARTAGRRRGMVSKGPPVRSPEPIPPKRGGTVNSPSFSVSASQLSRAQIAKVLRAARGRLSQCLKAAQAQKPAVIRLVVRGKDGRVVQVRVTGYASGHAVTRCLNTQARRLRFPTFGRPQQTLPPVRVTP